MPQQTVPGVAAQSGAPSHFQPREPEGHWLEPGSQVDVPVNGSQHCSPAAQVTLSAPDVPLKGQYTPGAVSA